MPDSTISRANFLKAMQGGTIDLSNMSDPLKKALKDAGVSEATLKKIARRNGHINGTSELNRLFDVVDNFDSNGSSNSFVASITQDDGTELPTQSGELFDALKAEASANREVALANADRRRYTRTLAGKHGVIDTHNMSAALKGELKKAGVTDAELAQVAGPDGQIKGAEFGNLHTLIDGKDGASDGTVSAKTKNADGTVTTTSVHDVNQAIANEVEANRKKDEYRQPGTRAAPTQRRRTIAKDPLVVPKAKQLPAVDLNVAGVNQYSLYPAGDPKADKACFEAAQKQLNDFNATAFPKKPPKLNGPDQVIQVAYQEDTNGRVVVDKKQAEVGRAYIDKALDKGYPVNVGVSYGDNRYNRDRLTDHFVTIHKRDYDSSGRLFYEFKDPGNGGKTGRFYVDKDTGKLFKEGDQKNRYVSSADYEITQVRTYEGLN